MFESTNGAPLFLRRSPQKNSLSTCFTSLEAGALLKVTTEPLLAEILSTRYEFPWDTVQALEVALHRTYCVPSISALLDRTGEFRNRPQRRNDDTAIIVAEMCEWGYDSERGRQALQRMNWVHGHYRISNADYLYVLSTFIYEPIRWNDRFGWRKMCEQEKRGSYYFWREVGKRMGITDIPPNYDAFENVSRDYERSKCLRSSAAH